MYNKFKITFNLIFRDDSILQLHVLLHLNRLTLYIHAALNTIVEFFHL